MLRAGSRVISWVKLFWKPTGTHCRGQLMIRFFVTVQLFPRSRCRYGRDATLAPIAHMAVCWLSNPALCPCRHGGKEIGRLLGILEADGGLVARWNASFAGLRCHTMSGACGWAGPRAVSYMITTHSGRSPQLSPLGTSHFITLQRKPRLPDMGARCGRRTHFISGPPPENQRIAADANLTSSAGSTSQVMITLRGHCLDHTVEEKCAGEHCRSSPLTQQGQAELPWDFSSGDGGSLRMVPAGRPSADSS